MNLKRVLFITFLFSIIRTFAIDGFYLGGKAGFLLKVDVESAFDEKNVVDETKSMDNSIETGLGQYGNTNPHEFPRVLEAMTGTYGDLSVIWGYKFPKLFYLGFGFMLSNFVMPSLVFDFKFSFREEHKIRPFVALSLYGGFLDGFPIGVTALGGMDIFFTEDFFLLVEGKLGAEIFVRHYYDDGNNANPIWHFDTVSAYGLIGINVGVGYIFKNKFTDENGKLIKR